MDSGVSINYVIATHAGRSLKREEHDAETALILIKHMKALLACLRHTTHIRQVTILKPEVDGAVYENYYDIDDYIAEIEKLGISVISHPTTQPFKSSYSQYLYAYTLFPEFDHYIIMEDDWVPFPGTKGFDAILLREYHKWSGCKGFLSAWVTKFRGDPTIDSWHRRHSAISVGIVSASSFRTISEVCRGAIYGHVTQLKFSELFTIAGLPLLDYSDSGSTYMIPFWETTEGKVLEYATHLSGKYLLVPVQLLEPDRYPYELGNWKLCGDRPASSEVCRWVGDKEYLSVHHSSRAQASAPTGIQASSFNQL